MLRVTEVDDIAPPPPPPVINLARNHGLSKAVDDYIDKAAADEPWGVDMRAVALKEAGKEADAEAAVARVNSPRASELLAAISPRGWVDVAAGTRLPLDIVHMQCSCRRGPLSVQFSSVQLFTPEGRSTSQ
jgi:hypothetical protein